MPKVTHVSVSEACSESQKMSVLQKTSVGTYEVKEDKYT